MNRNFRLEISLNMVLELAAGIPKRLPRLRYREIHQIARLQTPYPPCWRYSLVGGQVRQYALSARGETAKCVGDAAGPGYEKVRQELFEG